MQDMLLTLPFYISTIFIFTLACTIILFFRAMRFSYKSVLFFILWLGVQGILAYFGFYLDTSSFPPRFLLAILPPLLVISIALFAVKGKLIPNHVSIKALTLIHIVRVPIELVLYLLCIYKAVPALMTFSGRNFDILAGFSAPIIYYFGFIRKVLSFKAMLVWNVVCLSLLLNIIANAILSAPFPFQQFGFDQPNVAVLYFPYIWLPSVIVPVILFSHLVSIRHFLTPKRTE